MRTFRRALSRPGNTTRTSYLINTLKLDPCSLVRFTTSPRRPMAAKREPFDETSNFYFESEAEDDDSTSKTTELVSSRELPVIKAEPWDAATPPPVEPESPGVARRCGFISSPNVLRPIKAEPTPFSPTSNDAQATEDVQVAGTITIKSEQPAGHEPTVAELDKDIALLERLVVEKKRQRAELVEKERKRRLGGLGAKIGRFTTVPETARVIILNSSDDDVYIPPPFKRRRMTPIRTHTPSVTRYIPDGDEGFTRSASVDDDGAPVLSYNSPEDEEDEEDDIPLPARRQRRRIKHEPSSESEFEAPASPARRGRRGRRPRRPISRSPSSGSDDEPPAAPVGLPQRGGFGADDPTGSRYLAVLSEDGRLGPRMTIKNLLCNARFFEGRTRTHYFKRTLISAYLGGGQQVTWVRPSDKKIFPYEHSKPPASETKWPYDPYEGIYICPVRENWNQWLPTRAGEPGGISTISCYLEAVDRVYPLFVRAQRPDPVTGTGWQYMGNYRIACHMPVSLKVWHSAFGEVEKDFWASGIAEASWGRQKMWQVGILENEDSEITTAMVRRHLELGDDHPKRLKMYIRLLEPYEWDGNLYNGLRAYERRISRVQE